MHNIKLRNVMSIYLLLIIKMVFGTLFIGIFFYKKVIFWRNTCNTLPGWINIWITNKSICFKALKPSNAQVTENAKRLKNSTPACLLTCHTSSANYSSGESKVSHQSRCDNRLLWEPIVTSDQSCFVVTKRSGLLKPIPLVPWMGTNSSLGVIMPKCLEMSWASCQ